MLSYHRTLLHVCLIGRATAWLKNDGGPDLQLSSSCYSNNESLVKVLVANLKLAHSLSMQLQLRSRFLFLRKLAYLAMGDAILMQASLH